MVNMGLKADGGITVYYIPPYDGKSKVTAFKPVSLRFSILSRITTIYLSSSTYHSSAPKHEKKKKKEGKNHS